MSVQARTLGLRRRTDLRGLMNKQSLMITQRDR